jgi:hypothetical protein
MLNKKTPDFSKALQIANESGRAMIIEDDKPKYILINLEKESLYELTDDEKFEVSAKRILNKYRDAFEELAK